MTTSKSKKTQRKNNAHLSSKSIFGKINGTASQIAKQYENLAKDAIQENDSILAQNFYQYADHYHRIASSRA